MIINTIEKRQHLHTNRRGIIFPNLKLIMICGKNNKNISNNDRIATHCSLSVDLFAKLQYGLHIVNFIILRICKLYAKSHNQLHEVSEIFQSS